MSAEPNGGKALVMRNTAHGFHVVFAVAEYGMGVEGS
jgi:hypothetical protein